MCRFDPTGLAVHRRDLGEWRRAAACALAAVSIWAGWGVAARLAITASFDAWDIAALRFGVAGLLLAPVIVWRGFARDRLGSIDLLVLICGMGAPYALVAAGGLGFAPASDQGALNPGCMPLFVALIAAIGLGEPLSALQKAGLSLILAGALVMVGAHALGWTVSRLFGDALFLVAAFLTACGTIVIRRSKLEPLHAAALVATGSLIIYLPLYLAFHKLRLPHPSRADFIAQAIFQGFIVTIVALVLYARAVQSLGAPSAAAFGAMVPALSALFAIPLLGEWPNTTDWLAILLISAGVYCASGMPLPRPGGRCRKATR